MLLKLMKWQGLGFIESTLMAHMSQGETCVSQVFLTFARVNLGRLILSD
jgi:hypothetical protein